MGYYSDDMTEEELGRLEKRIARVYRRAYIEMHAQAEDYFSTLNEERYQKEYEAYERGEYTKAQFDLWYQTQVMRGQGYEQMRDSMARQMSDANKIASEYINNTTPSIASLNYNYEAYEIAQAHGIDFHLADANTIRELMSEANHVEFKTVRTNPVRDYQWNRGQINSILTSGIIQGKSIDELKDSFLVVMKRNKASAIRNARTAVTSAQNGGRQASYEQASKMGTEIEKEWISTLDERTRLSHAMRDGKRVPYDKEFADGLMYPADAGGAPAEVYNCRCTMRAILPKINDEKRETYADWMARMAEQDNLTTDTQKALERWNKANSKSFDFKPENSYYKPIDFTGFNNMTEEEMATLNARFMALDAEWGAEVSEITDKLQHEQREYDLYYENFVNAKMAEGMSRKKAEKTATELLGERPESVSLLLCGEYHQDEHYITLNSRSMKHYSNECNRNIDDDAKKREEYWQKQERRAEEGRRKRNLDNVAESLESTLIHEYGHAVDFHYRISEDKRFIAYYERFSEEQIQKGVSGYATTNIQEFLAECFAESYLPNGREMGREAIKIIREIVSDSSK